MCQDDCNTCNHIYKRSKSVELFKSIWIWHSYKHIINEEENEEEEEVKDVLDCKYNVKCECNECNIGFDFLKTNGISERNRNTKMKWSKTYAAFTIQPNRSHSFSILFLFFFFFWSLLLRHSNRYDSFQFSLALHF